MLEDKIIKAQIVKDDANIDKYNIDAVTSFMKTVLADLGETYRKSNLAQLKVLLGLTFPNGITWDYNDRLDPKISPLYKAIQGFDNRVIPSGAGEGSRTPYVHFGKVTFYR